MLRRSSFFALAFVVVMLSGACVTDDSVDLVIATGGLDLDAQTSLEVRISPGACPAIEDVVLGDPSRPVAANSYWEFGPSTVSLPPVGVLEDLDYTFIAVLRDASCTPLRYGCVVANPARAATVTIATTDPRGVNLGTFCGPGAACSGSVCVSDDEPTECAVGDEGAECRLSAGETGICCDGRCTEEGTTADGCSPTTPPCTDPAAPCSECAEGCIDGTVCHGTTCGPADTVTVIVDTDTGRVEGLYVGLAWRGLDLSGTAGSVVAVSDAQSFDAAGDRAVVTLPEAPPRDVLDAVGGTPGGAIVAEVVVAPDADGDGFLGLSEVTTRADGGGTPSPYGISSDVGVLYVQESIGASLAEAVGFTGDPPVGVHAYVRAGSRETPSFSHASDPVTVVTPCTHAWESADQADCVAALPSALPF